MQEGDSLAFGSDTRFAVYELKPGVATTLECRVQIVDGEAYVMNPGAPPGDEPGNRRRRIVRFQKLHQWLSCLQAHDPRAISVIERGLLQAENISEEREGRRKRVNRNSNVRNASAARGCSGH